MVETNKTTEEGCEAEKEKVEEVEVKSVLCKLPPELQVLIASFLFAGDSTAFRRLVSKSLTSNLGTLTIPISPQHHPEIPYLISLYGDNVLKFYHPTLMCSYRVQLQELSEARIRCSNHGWLLLSTIDYDVFFFEPFSKEKIQLPRPKCPYNVISMCFSSPPTSMDCFVLGIDFYGDKFDIIRRGETRWTTRSLNKNMRQRFSVCAGVPLIVHDGLCYCLGDDGDVGIFDPDAQQPDLIVVGNCYQKDLRDSLRQPYLVVRNNGEILSVLVFADKKVEIRQMGKGRWRKQTSWENEMLFLCSTGSFMGSTDLREMYNKIYFPMSHEDALLFYCLHHKKYLSFHSDYSSEDCNHHVKDFSINSAWITPAPSNSIGGEW